MQPGDDYLIEHIPHKTKGSSRPPGGGEAPAHGGRSGAARRCRALQMTELQIPIPPEVFWPGLSILGILAAIFLVYGVLALNKVETPWLDNAKRQMGLHVLNSGFVAVGITLYLLIASLVFGGLCLLIWDTIRDGLLGQSDDNRELFRILRIAGLTTVLGAIVALPVSLTRLRLTREQVATAERSLFNEKINAALEDLYSRRQFTLQAEDGTPKGDVWHDDITRRNAAIDRLERLALEDKSFAPDIARMLAIYVRELSKENPAEKPPQTKDLKVLERWAKGLTPNRTDMENAAQTLGRLMGNPRLREKDIDLRTLPLDLRNTNLQAFDLKGLCFERARLTEAQLQGARLERAQLRGVFLVEAELQEASLSEARLQDARLNRAQLQGANLDGARLQGAALSGAQLQEASLSEARLQGARLGGAQLQGAYLVDARLQSASLNRAELQGSILAGARLQGANLVKVRLQGAELSMAKFDSLNSLTAATFRGASVKEVDFTNVRQIAEHLPDLFGDASVKLPEGVTAPEHWAKTNLEWGEFEDAWRAWQRAIGQDPDNPA